MSQISLKLPWPPSVNTYWRHPTNGKLAGRHLISEKGRAYRAGVIAAVLQQLPPRRRPDWFGSASPRLALDLHVYPPDLRRRDLDNIVKAVLDGLAHAGVYADDSQIDRLTIRRMPPHRPKGMACAMLAPILEEAEA